MTEQQRNVDCLLATGASKSIHAGEMMQQMRAAYRDGDQDRYWKIAKQLADVLMIAGHCLEESHRTVLAQQMLSPKSLAAAAAVETRMLQ